MGPGVDGVYSCRRRCHQRHTHDCETDIQQKEAWARTRIFEAYGQSKLSLGQYLRTINSLKDELISISKCMVADAFFSKESFVSGLNSLGFSLISRFRDDVRLKYLYTGPKTGQRGRPKKFIGDVDLKKLDMGIFETFASGDIAIYSAIVWAVSLKREVKVVIADFNEPDKKAKSRKVFFSTDTSKSALTYLKFTELDFKSSFCTVTQSNILACAIASQGIATPWVSPLTCRYPQLLVMR